MNIHSVMTTTVNLISTFSPVVTLCVCVCVMRPPETSLSKLPVFNIIQYSIISYSSVQP